MDSQEIGIKRRVPKNEKGGSDTKAAETPKKKKKKKKKIQLSEEDKMRKSKLILEVNGFRNTLRELKKKQGKEEGIEEKIASCTKQIDLLSEQIRKIISAASAAAQSASPPSPPTTTALEG